MSLTSDDLADIKQLMEALLHAQEKRMMQAMNERFAAQDARINKRFEELEERFEKRFQEIDRRFTGIDNQFTGMDNRFTGMDDRFTGMDRRFKRIEDQLDEQNEKIDTILDAVGVESNDQTNQTEENTKKLANHESRILRLEARPAS